MCCIHEYTIVDECIAILCDYISMNSDSTDYIMHGIVTASKKLTDNAAIIC